MLRRLRLSEIVNDPSFKKSAFKLLAITDRYGITTFIFRVALWCFPSEPTLMRVCYNHISRTMSEDTILKMIETTLRQIHKMQKSGVKNTSLKYQRKFHRLFMLLFLNANKEKIANFLLKNIKALQPIAQTSIANNFIFNLMDIKNIGAFFKESRISKIDSLPSADYTFSTPILLNDRLKRSTHTLKIPDSCIFKIPDATIFSAAQILLDDVLMVYEPAAHPKNGMVAGIWPHIARVYGKDDSALVKYSVFEEKSIDQGILITGRCSVNYFHWVVEYLSRIFTLEQHEQFNSIPLIVDKGLTKQHYQALAVLNHHDRDIIFTDQRSLLHCKELFIPNFHTRILDTLDEPLWKSSGYSIEHLRFVKEETLRHIIGHKKHAKKDRRIYISRRNVHRRSIVNEDKIEDLVRKYDFEIIYPEQLNYLEQARLFNTSEFIIAPGGAAMTNLIFCQEGTKVIAMQGYESRDSCFFLGPARVGPVDYYNFTGPHTHSRDFYKTDVEYFLSSFSIDVDQLEKAILRVLSDEVPELLNKAS